MRRYVSIACGVGVMSAFLMGSIFVRPGSSGTAKAATPLAADLPSLALQAVSTDQYLADRAIQALRQAGPAGLAALRATHAREIDAYLRSNKAASPAEAIDARAWQRLQIALDTVSAQRDSAAAGLYWEVDMEHAKQRALAENKPILALYMLGRLTDELSCANSRFFRSILYPNEKIRTVLAEQFVLVWQTERPVPVVTIDFGDGRKLVRTVTGNSVHYVLDARGRVVDAIPGLYGPEAFLRALRNAEPVARQSTYTAANGDLLRAYHQQRGLAIDAAFDQDLAALGRNPGNAPSTKRTDRNAPPDDELWQQLAARHTEDAKIDPAGVAFIERKAPLAGQAGLLAVSKAIVETPLVRMLRHLHMTVAVDTVRNEYVLHRQIHDWFCKAPVVDLPALNERVYAQLFLTPRSDPWLGLLPGVYSGLENGGVILPPPAVTATSAPPRAPR